MSLRTLVLFLLICSGFALPLGWYLHRTAPQRARRHALEALLLHEGKDLSRLREEERREVESHLWQLVPECRYGGHPGGQSWPWRVSRLGPPSSGSLVLIVAVGPGMWLPYSDDVRISLVDEEGNLRWSSGFPAGVWNTVERTTLVMPREIEVPCVRIDYETGFSALFAIQERGPCLVRLEGMGGRPWRSNYCRRALMPGPRSFLRTDDGWQRLTLSENASEVLHALVWLSGVHVHAADARLSCPPTDEERRAELFERVRAKDPVVRRILELRHSPNRWIREYADLAATPAICDD